MRGPLPKPDSERINRRKRPDVRVVEMERAGQPPLDPDRNWPRRTQEWWAMWGRSPLSADFTEAEWSELLDTAMIHARLWDPSVPPHVAMKAASELRQRTAKYGATPEDRLRLRMQFAFADKAENEAGVRREGPKTDPPASASPTGSRSRRGPLRAV